MGKIAIIPARGGSKRILRKNIKSFLGKPIIAYSIKAAIESKLFDEVMVSTDDDEIKEIALEYGAKVPFLRSDINSNDYATTADVINEVISKYEAQERFFKFCVCIYPTAPFVTSIVLEKALNQLISKDFDCVFPVLAYSYPTQRALRVNEEHKMEMIQPSNLNVRSQDLEQSYHDAGQFYAFNIHRFKETQKLWTVNTGVLKINALEAQDIDTITDWKLAELKYKLIHGIS